MEKYLEVNIRIFIRDIFLCNRSIDTAPTLSLQIDSAISCIGSVLDLLNFHNFLSSIYKLYSIELDHDSS